MNKQDIQDLLNRHHEGETTPEEEVQLNLWYHKEAGSSDWNHTHKEEIINDRLKQGIDARIDQLESETLKSGNWYKYAAAAIILIAFSVGFYFYTSVKEQHFVKDSYAGKDIAPGSNKAILTLADGSKISLTDAVDGQLATQSGIVITKAADGQLVYTVNDAQSNNSGALAYNTITTPRGGQHIINLPDGTRVWLNSESSVKFPVSFTNLKERKVELIGEAYFEVSPNKSQPFSVRSNEQIVKVFGTHFNVMAYSNERNMETTLLEGKVSVKSGAKETFIKPGQQVQLKAGEMNVLNNADVDAVVAWKNQVFQFDNTDIDKVLRQIERWYDVDVTYSGTRTDVSFTGVIPRNVNVSRILKALEQTCGLKFEIEGQKIKVINHKTKY